MVSMSSITSPISSGPIQAGSHNSALAQRICRYSLFLLMIGTWWVPEIKVQCHFEWFLISNKHVIRHSVIVNQDEDLKRNMIYLDKQWDQQPGTVDCLKGRAVWKRWGYRRCWRSREWKRTVPKRGCKAPTGNENCPNLCRSAETCSV